MAFHQHATTTNCLRTILVAFNLKKAFDAVSHAILLKHILETNMPCVLKKWVNNYLNGRKTLVDFRGSQSKMRRLKQGVPQGGVQSPSLFNLYIGKLPLPPLGIETITYADDCSILASGTDLRKLCGDLNTYLNPLNIWFQERNFMLSYKPTATLFTTWTKEMKLDLDITINTRCHTCSMLTFNAHAMQTPFKMRKRNNALKAISVMGERKRNINDHMQSNWQNASNCADPDMVSPTSKHTLEEASDLSELSATHYIGLRQNGR